MSVKEKWNLLHFWPKCPSASQQSGSEKLQTLPFPWLFSFSSYIKSLGVTQRWWMSFWASSSATTFHITLVHCCTMGDVRSWIRLNWSSPSGLKCNSPEKLFNLILKREAVWTCWCGQPWPSSFSSSSHPWYLQNSGRPLVCLLFSDTEAGDWFESCRRLPRLGCTEVFMKIHLSSWNWVSCECCFMCMMDCCVYRGENLYA